MASGSGNTESVPEVEPAHRRSFAPTPDVVSAARRFVSSSLDERFDEVESDVSLLTSELVTNAVLHARTDLTVEVEVAGKQVTVRVSDRGAGRPLVRSFSATSGSGRGLRLLETIATDWGSSSQPDGTKIVWFCIDAAAPVRSAQELALDFDSIEAL